MQIDINIHTGGSSPLRQRQPIRQIVLRVAVARPDPNTREVASAVFEDGFEIGCGAVVFVADTRVFEIDEGGKVGAAVGDGNHPRGEESK